MKPPERYSPWRTGHSATSTGLNRSGCPVTSTRRCFCPSEVQSAMDTVETELFRFPIQEDSGSDATAAAATSAASLVTARLALYRVMNIFNYGFHWTVAKKGAQLMYMLNVDVTPLFVKNLPRMSFFLVTLQDFFFFFLNPWTRIPTWIFRAISHVNRDVTSYNWRNI